MMALLDTVALIDMARSKRSPHFQKLSGLISAFIAQGQTIFTSRINEAEFRVGGFRSPAVQREIEYIEDVLNSTVILEFDGKAAIRYAELQSYLLDIGRPTGVADTFIAAIASVNNQPIVTRNTKDFKDIPGLQIIGY
jgi:predicted nucleic acid-binding protein